ncbi:MAG: hypothetical protein GXZ13_07320 [Synergistaceae bacterium]|nr:hypothetical protein [Synergistaceae bacterium]
MIDIFGNVIYYDEKKIMEYSSVITRQHHLTIKEYEISDDKSAHMNLKVFGGDLKGSKKYKAEVKESLLYNCVAFEKLLNGREDFADFVESSKWDINTIGRGFIIKFNGYMNVPEEFDITQTIQRFKPMLMDSIVNDGMDETEKKAFKSFFEVSDVKIPVLIDIEDSLICSKLVGNNMLVEYEDLDEYEDLEVTIIARVTSNNLIDMKKPFYDPLKDFMKLNRTLRRNMSERAEGLYEIYADQNYKTVEILAIYQ